MVLEKRNAPFGILYFLADLFIFNSQTVIKNIEVKARFLRLEGKFFFFIIYLIKKDFFLDKKIIYICIFIYVYISQFQLNDPSMVSFFLWILKKIFFSFSKKFEYNWDLVDSASSHMLVSRTKPCMPQNNCYAGVCAWLITSDAICRKNVAETHYWIPCAKRQANTWTNGLVPFNTP